MNITAKTKVCLVIGDPVEHSLSPQMHNAGYAALSIDDEFVYVACRVKIADLLELTRGVRAMVIRGISCTIPHKIAIIPYLDEIEKTAKTIGAVNTVVNDNGVLKGYNADWRGIVVPLEKITSLQNKKVALLGAGGTARAVAYAITKKGAQLAIYNRTFSKAQALAKEFGGQARSIRDIDAVKNADIIINATAIGLHPADNKTPVAKKFITKRQIVFDVVYSPYETKLLREAKQQGARIIHGMDMLVEQAMAQFELFTKRRAPQSPMRNVLLRHLPTKEK